MQFLTSAIFGVGSNSRFCQSKRSKFSFEYIKESNLWSGIPTSYKIKLEKSGSALKSHPNQCKQGGFAQADRKQAKLHYHTQLTPDSCQVTGPIITCQMIQNLDIPLPDFCLSCEHVSKFMPALYTSSTIHCRLL